MSSPASGHQNDDGKRTVSGGAESRLSTWLKALSTWVVVLAAAVTVIWGVLMRVVTAWLAVLAAAVTVAQFVLEVLRVHLGN